MHWGSCKECRLCETRRKVVYGTGDVPARLLYIAQAPGKCEDATGEPLVGESGWLLNQAIKKALDGRTEISSFKTSVLGCRPPEDRAPMKAEIEACRPRVEEIIRRVKPEIIILLGSVARIACARLAKKYKIPTVEVFHPAYVLRRGALHSMEFLHLQQELKEVFNGLFQTVERGKVAGVSRMDTGMRGVARRSG